MIQFLTIAAVLSALVLTRRPRFALAGYLAYLAYSLPGLWTVTRPYLSGDAPQDDVAGYAAVIAPVLILGLGVWLWGLWQVTRRQ